MTWKRRGVASGAALLQKVQTAGINIIGMTMMLRFVASFDFVLSAHSPQGMVAPGTEMFVPRDFIRVARCGSGRV